MKLSERAGARARDFTFVASFYALLSLLPRKGVCKRCLCYHSHPSNTGLFYVILTRKPLHYRWVYINMGYGNGGTRYTYLAGATEYL